MASRHGATSSSAHPDVFTPRPGGLGQSVGLALGARRPLFAAFVIWIVAFLMLGATIIVIGLLLTHVLSDTGFAGLDADVIRWFAAEREPALDTATWFGSAFGSTGVVLTVSLVAGGILLVIRRWRHFGFLLFAMTLEFGLFLLTVTIVGRHRPEVQQLDAAPPTSSFPSGHTAAAFTLYVGLAVVSSSFVRSRLASGLVWTAAVVLPLVVGLSRLYRGMHFPTDVTAGALLACVAVLSALFAVRCTVAASAERVCRAAETCRSPEHAHAHPHQEVVS